MAQIITPQQINVQPYMPDASPFGRALGLANVLVVAEREKRKKKR